MSDYEIKKSPHMALRALCTVYIFLSLVVQWVLIWLIQVIYILVSMPFTTKEQRQDACGHIFRFVSFVGMDLLNPFWHIHVTNKFPKTENKKVILMMNHLSGADPFVAIRSMLPRDGSWIAKDSLFKVPLGGWAMANADDLRVVFRNKKAGFETVKGTVGPMMQQAAAKLRRGRMICVFPEGVRSYDPDGGLNPFRLGFFQLALDEGAVIVPLGISGTDRLWPRSGTFMDAADAFFTFGEPIEAKNFTDAQELANHTFKVITDLRESHPDRIALHKAQAARAAAADPAAAPAAKARALPTPAAPAAAASEPATTVSAARALPTVAVPKASAASKAADDDRDEL